MITDDRALPGKVAALACPRVLVTLRLGTDHRHSRKFRLIANIYPSRYIAAYCSLRAPLLSHIRDKPVSSNTLLGARFQSVPNEV